jgi:hypothetical protein
VHILYAVECLIDDFGLILACARIGDLRRARATQTAIGDFGLKPNLDTYNLLLEACIAAEHRALGDTLLSV